jgi:hypothetical protein
LFECELLFTAHLLRVLALLKECYKLISLLESSSFEFSGIGFVCSELLGSDLVSELDRLVWRVFLQQVVKQVRVEEGSDVLKLGCGVHLLIKNMPNGP